MVSNILIGLNFFYCLKATAILALEGLGIDWALYCNFCIYRMGTSEKNILFAGLRQDPKSKC